MLCKPAFIVHIRVKGILESYTVVQNEELQLQKWIWHIHTNFINMLGFKFQHK